MIYSGSYSKMRYNKIRMRLISHRIEGLPHRESNKNKGLGIMRKEGEQEGLERSAVHLLHRAGQCAADIFDGEMAEADLTPRQYAVLATVAQNEGLSQTGLVERTGIDRSTLADVVRRMLKKGLLQRRRTREDARAYAVKLTEEGWRVLKLAEPTAKDVDERILAALPTRQREQFLSDLQTIIRLLSASVAKPDKD